MAWDINTQIAQGRLTEDPKVRESQNGQKVVTCSIATSYGKDDKKKTEFHNFVSFGYDADDAEGLELTKGDSVIAVGQVKTRKWEGQDGQTKRRTELVGSIALRRRGRKQVSQRMDYQPQRDAKPAGGAFDGDDDDMPF